ncbi:hypothetical protein Ccrd_013468 [Cynara cardunculus var. scolymus]|uniref:Uncharacterized protein n=1 Tax=Cynara cardunculus var. scolymus TaxID=59895 RepID=A0A124SH18_CYNCS|nr:hypothetical protein Ccrd_013468 [Cynara cardunculus var. scolymus]
MRNFQPFLSHNPHNSLLQHQPLWVSTFGFYTCCQWKKRGSGTNNSILPNRAVDRDSEFEIDPDKAREALRKLDQQLDLISQKQSNPVPKIKVVIKPSIDGPQVEVSPAGSSIMTQVLKAELLQLSPSPDQPSTSTLINSDQAKCLTYFSSSMKELGNQQWSCSLPYNGSKHSCSIRSRVG